MTPTIGTWEAPALMPGPLPMVAPVLAGLVAPVVAPVPMEILALVAVSAPMARAAEANSGS